MSVLTYTAGGESNDKPLAWLHGKVKTPPFSVAARLEAGFLLRRLQRGDMLAMAQSRPIPGVGPRCHKSTKTPNTVLEICRRRLKEYDRAGK